MVRLETIENLLANVPHSPYRQAIINGNFDIWQRGTSFSTTGWTADRWNCYLSDSSSIARQAFAVGQADVPNNPQYYARCTTSGQAGAGDLSVLIQKIENVQTFSGQTVSGSFWAKANSACNVAIELAQSFGTGGSASIYGIGAVKVAITTTWSLVKFTITLPSVSGKTIGDSSSLALHIWFSAGSDFNTRTDSLGIQNKVVDVAQVQLNIGDKPFLFVPKTVNQELLDCWRYYYRIPYTEIYGMISSGSSVPNSTTLCTAFMNTPVVMRKKPTFNWSNPSHFYFGDGGGVITPTGFQAFASYRYTGTNMFVGCNASGFTMYRAYNFLFGGTSSAWVEMDAEL